MSVLVYIFMSTPSGNGFSSVTMTHREGAAAIAASSRTFACVLMRWNMMKEPTKHILEHILLQRKKWCNNLVGKDDRKHKILRVYIREAGL